MTPRSLYIHVPFCERRCDYCDFASQGGLRGEHDYMVALDRELHALADALPQVELDTIFVGGGTPSYVQPRLLAGILETVRTRWRISADAEITMEANPSSITPQRAAIWRRAGVNRISVGVQSLHADILQFLNRVHDAPRALQAVADVRSAGFENVSCDLIYAVPGLDDERWRSTLEQVIDAAPDHISCYELTVEEGTPLHRRVRHQEVRIVDDDRALAQHWIANQMLTAAGLDQYEISNWAKANRQCRHNLAYWRNAHWLAAGVGAHGHLSPSDARAIGIDIATGDDSVAVRWWHPRTVSRYLAQGATRAVPWSGAEAVSAADHEAERLLVGLRCNSGVEITDVAVSDIAETLVASALMWRDGSRYGVTPRGQEVLDAVIRKLTSSVVAV